MSDTHLNIWKHIKTPSRMTVVIVVVTTVLTLGLNIAIFAMIMAGLFGLSGQFAYKSYQKMELGQNVPEYFAEFTREKFWLYFLACLAIAFPMKFLPLLFGF